MAKSALERLPYFRFHCADYLIDTMTLPDAQHHGAYLLLIVNYYWNGSVPSSRAEIAAIAKAPETVVDLILKRYFHEENGRFIHHRIERELEAYGDMIRSNSAAGKRSAELRAANKTTEPPTATKPKPKRAKSELQAMPPDWLPKPQTVERLAAQFGFKNGDAQRYLDAFRDACAAKSYKYADFDAAFTNCVRQDWPRFRAGAATMPMHNDPHEPNWS